MKGTRCAETYSAKKRFILIKCNFLQFRIDLLYKLILMEKAFIEMINKHSGIVYKVCSMYGLEEEDQKDLFQEIVLQLWKSFPSFRQDSQSSTWMYRVALNTAISSFRKESRIPARTGLSSAELEIPDACIFSDQEYQQGVLKQALGQLTKIEKAVILLYFEEKNYQEIAEITGMTKTNVGVKISRIKLKLEKIIKS